MAPFPAGGRRMLRAAGLATGLTTGLAHHL